MPGEVLVLVVGSVLARLLMPPRPVLTLVARCFPQVVPGMFLDIFQHPSSSLGVFRWPPSHMVASLHCLCPLIHLWLKLTSFFQPSIQFSVSL